MTSTEHFPGCPCGTCQGVRAAQPVTHAMQAKHLSGASIGKQVEWEVGRSILTSEHQWSPSGELGHLTHGPDGVELHIRWDAANWDRIGIKPDDWVRVTQVPAT